MLCEIYLRESIRRKLIHDIDAHTVLNSCNSRSVNILKYSSRLEDGNNSEVSPD